MPDQKDAEALETPEAIRTKARELVEDSHKRSRREARKGTQDTGDEPTAKVGRGE